MKPHLGHIGWSPDYASPIMSRDDELRDMKLLLWKTTEQLRKALERVVELETQVGDLTFAQLKQQQQRAN